MSSNILVESIIIETDGFVEFYIDKSYNIMNTLCKRIDSDKIPGIVVCNLRESLLVIPDVMKHS